MNKNIRNFVLISAILLSISDLVHSQTPLQEVVYLKNGSMIRGTVIEQIVGQSLKIQTADGSIFVYRMDEVEKITKESPIQTKRAVSLVPAGNIIGYRGFVDFGYTQKLGGGANRIGVKYMLSETFALNLSLGYSYQQDEGDNLSGISIKIGAEF